ncbi:hypothetical protein SY2F82_04870 [Streptomyces sp. Y2F8-2]|nr:hypothetical protein SY2F82_04870 [Streptomyces sp. Y2F8-2]
MATAWRWWGIISCANVTSCALWPPCAAEAAPEGAAGDIDPMPWPECPDEAEDEAEGEEEGEEESLPPQAVSTTAAVAAAASATVRRIEERRNAMRSTAPWNTPRRRAGRTDHETDRSTPPEKAGVVRAPLDPQKL